MSEMIIKGGNGEGVYKWFAGVLEQLAETGNSRIIDILLSNDSLTDEETRLVVLLNNTLNTYKSAVEYDMMKYKLTSDTLGVALWDMKIVNGDPRHPENITEWSQEFRQVLGFTDKNDFPDSLSSLLGRIHPEDADRAEIIVAEHLSDPTGETPFDMECRLMLKNGEYRYFNVFANSLRDENGVPLRIAGAMRDIDERVKMQNQYMIMSSIVHKSPNFISYKKLFGDCMYVNPAATQMTGYSHEELMDDYLGKLFSEKAQEYATEVYHDLQKKGLAEFKYLATAKDGTDKLLSGMSFMIEDDAFATIASDITEANNVEAERQQNYMTMQSMFNGIDAMIYVTDPETSEILFINENMKNHYELGDDVNGKVCYEVLQEGINERCEFCPCRKLDVDPESVVIWEEHSTLTSRVYRNTDRYIDWVGGKKAHIQHSVDITDIMQTQESISRMAADIREANERLMLMLDTSPLCAQVWDRELNTIDCNEAAVKLYGFKDKQEYTDRFITSCSPEYQPDGQLSSEKAVNLVYKAFEEGYCRFDWMHKMPDDDIKIPAEVTLVRAKYKDDDVVIGYTRDMREHDRMMKDIAYRDNMLLAVNEAAALLLAVYENEDIETPLTNSMELVGSSINLDQAHIWKKETIDGELQFTRTYSWFEKGGEAALIPDKLDNTGGHLSNWSKKFKVGSNISGLISKMPKKDREVLSGLGMESAAVIPLYISEQFWGLFIIGDHAQKRVFTEDEITILRSVSFMMESAINRRLLMAEINETHDRMMHKLETLVEDRTKELAQQTAMLESHYEYAKRLNETLAKVTNSPVISSGNINDAADFMVREGCIALNTSSVSIWVLSDDADTLVNVSYYNNIINNYCEQEDFSLSNRGQYAELLKTERLIVTNNIKEKYREIIGDDYGPDMCAMLDAPIRVDGKLTGVVCAEQEYNDEYRDKREWLIDEQNFLSSLADLISLAISGFELREARDFAEVANQAKSSFLANMSHEIRTPMNAILGITDILMQKEILPKDIEEGLSRIYSSCDMLLGIINDILDFSKIEAGKMDILPDQYNVASLINDSVHLNVMRTYGRPIEFELQVDEKTPALLIGDELRIKQILNNLLSNAFKFTEAGKVTLTIVSELMPDGDGVTLVLIIRDTGCGMTPDQLTVMFDEYSRFSSHTGKTTEGTGLGLAITNRLTKLMGGGLQVESEPGVGSMFAVRLPQKTVNDDVLGHEVADNLQKFHMNYLTRSKRGQIIRDPMPYGSVLIVDDVETNIYVSVGLLKPYGLKVDAVMSGLETIEKIKNGAEYDIIFMDHMMPEMDGMEATKLLREMGYTKTIVALTANVVAGQSEVFLQNGFDEFISKPIDIRQLNAVLNKHVRDKQSPEVIEAARREKRCFDLERVSIDDQRMTGTDGAVISRLDGKIITGLDIVQGLERYDGDEDAYLRILRSYVASVRSKLDEMEAVNEDTLKSYKITVHGIKGASFDIFADSTGRKAALLEKAAADDDIDYVSKHNKLFLDEARILVEEIDAVLSSIDKANIKPMKDKPDAGVLSKLLAACSLYKMDDVDEAMAELDIYRYESDNGLVAILREHADMMNFPQIVEILTKELN